MKRFLLIVFPVSLFLFSCSIVKPLTDAEKAKLDRYLIHLLSGETVDERMFDVQKKVDGTKEYAVIVLSEDPETIRALGINVSSVFGDVIVVHATVEELIRIVSLPSVRALKVGSKKTIQRSQ